jgi:hypothetical protein
VRSTLAALLMCAVACMTVGAHHVDPHPTVIAPAPQRSDDIYSSTAAARHRAAQAPHWGAMVLMPRR